MALVSSGAVDSSRAVERTGAGQEPVPYMHFLLHDSICSDCLPGPATLGMRTHMWQSLDPSG